MAGANPGSLASDEHDLCEAMRLSARLTSIGANAARAGRRTEEILAELVGRYPDER
jgi:hypothetical protein